MKNKTQPLLDFWTVQVPGWLLLVYLAVAQGVAAFSYDLGVAMGTQEKEEAITEVGVAFWHGFAIGDLLIYIPLLFLGLVGRQRRSRWGTLVLASALGITIYWPIVSLAALIQARGAAGWVITNEVPFWVVCLTVWLWACWALFLVVAQEIGRIDRHSGHQARR